MLAATNRPDVLDPALLRPGRFDRHVTLNLPDKTARRAILDIHARDLPLEDTGDLDIMAAGTPGFSGADLKNLLNEAAIDAARRECQPDHPRRSGRGARQGDDGHGALACDPARGETPPCGARGRPYCGGLLHAGGRPAVQGHDHSARPCPGRYPHAARKRTPHPGRGLSARPACHAAGRARRRKAADRHGQFRRRRRYSPGDRPGAVDGGALGHDRRSGSGRSAPIRRSPLPRPVHRASRATTPTRLRRKSMLR